MIFIHRKRFLKIELLQLTLFSHQISYYEKTSVSIFITGFCYVSLYSQTFIKNVTIVDVVNKKLIPAQTVVINKDVITDVQKAGKNISF